MGMGAFLLFHKSKSVVRLVEQAFEHRLRRVEEAARNLERRCVFIRNGMDTLVVEAEDLRVGQVKQDGRVGGDDNCASG